MTQIQKVEILNKVFMSLLIHNYSLREKYFCPYLIKEKKDNDLNYVVHTLDQR